MQYWLMASYPHCLNQGWVGMRIPCVMSRLSPGLRFTQRLTTFTNLYGIFTPPLRLFTPFYAPLQITFCKTTTQISDYIDFVLALSRSRSHY
jgi:hypothetical protein